MILKTKSLSIGYRMLIVVAVVFVVGIVPSQVSALIAGEQCGGAGATCNGGLACVPTAIAGIQVCAPFPADEGDWCGPADEFGLPVQANCRNSLVCIFNPAPGNTGAAGLCRPVNGMACTIGPVPNPIFCPVPFSCVDDGSGTSGTCRQNPGPGQICDPVQTNVPGLSCPLGFQCTGPGPTYTCQPYSGTCTNDQQCIDPGSVCAVVPGTNPPFSKCFLICKNDAGVSNWCPPGYQCILGSNGGLNLCHQAVACLGLNADCSWGIDCCSPAVCTMGGCQDPPGVSPPPPPPEPLSPGIPLLESIRGNTYIPTAAGGFGPFFYYFNLLYPWIVGLGGAISVLMGLIGGIQIMTAGSDQGKRSAGINRFMVSVAGLLLLLFSSLILNLLNPTFFK